MRSIKCLKATETEAETMERWANRIPFLYLEQDQRTPYKKQKDLDKFKASLQKSGYKLSHCSFQYTRYIKGPNQSQFNEVL